MNYDLEAPYGTVDWKSTNCNKSELIIAYNIKARNNTLHRKVFYTLCIEPSNDNNSHLIYDLSTDKIVVSTNYLSVPIPADLFEPINRTESSNNKIQVDHFDVEHSIVCMGYSTNKKYKSRTPNNNKDDSSDKDTNGLGNSQHLDNLMSDKIVYHGDQVMLTKESYKSTNVSMNESTNIDNPTPSLILQCLYTLPGLSLQYRYKAVITILCLCCMYKNTSNFVHLLPLIQISIHMSIREDILHHLYKYISMVMLLLVSLHTAHLY